MGKIEFTTALHRFDKQGEKTGWTYIELPAELAAKIKPGKKGFRVKGKLDSHKISQVSLLPMGGGSFILPVNATMRKGIGKKHGAMVKVILEEDKKPFEFNKDLIECLADDPAAKAFFNSLAGSVQRYFSKWIDEAKTEQTRTRRIAQAVSALSRSTSFQEMIRNLKAEKNRLEDK
ncbi:MAG TPA: YdeI/OmpD-associated family protein [Chitinophagaceae bacterium]|nr:YdeI/OmpD-associated family protein [Chitinophagaceae bacterium]